MVYLFLKEVAESTDATEVIIVVQSLCKDMNNSVDIYRSNSIRTLSKIIDVRCCAIGDVVVWSDYHHALLCDRLRSLLTLVSGCNRPAV